MTQTVRMFFQLVMAIIATGVPCISMAQASLPKIGIVIMHGKGGSPARHVSDLASSLERNGCLVANLEMPWSGRRDYDVSVSAAEKEVESALAALRDKGAQKLFVSGHSQGGLFALYLGGRLPIDGVIAIAPGGNVGSSIFRDRLGESVENARKLVAEGKGGEKARFLDYEGAKGTYPIVTTPVVYLDWFNPDGAMNQAMAVKAMNPKIPVLFIVPTHDHPGLLKVKQAMFNALPGNPLNKLYEPDSNHLGAPSASQEEIMRWVTEVAVASKR